MSRALWIDEGNDADYAKLTAHGITAPYYSMRDPRVTADYLQAVRTRGFQPGIYAVENWWPTLSGAQFADKVSAFLQHVAPGTAPDFPRVLLDMETHDVSYILAALARWRQARPKRITDWTLEGFQGGLFNPAAVAAITAAKVGIAPQFYSGNMAPLEHGVTLDLLIAGFPGDRLVGMYDAAALPWSWRGFAFSQGRLP